MAKATMPATELIYVPFNAAGVPTGVARMPQAIQAAGVEQAVAPARSTWITVTEMTTARGPSGLLSEAALSRMVTDSASALRAAWHRRAIPIVIAGDCPILLAPSIAAAMNGREAGLVFIDGHEDAWDPRATPTGEASDCEMGLALGLFSGPQALDLHLPCLRAQHVAILGPRDQAELLEAGQPSLRDRVAVYVDGSDLAARTDVAGIADLVAHSAGTAPGGWWCHVDLDVLATASLPAVDYPQPGGLTWEQLEHVTSACLTVAGCLGASVVIYNPDLDDGRSAGRIADFIAFVRDRLTTARPR
ncbi:arginase family protein [Mycolicibacterium wolinskyi]|nr:arginase family protein [Mycolicibacterium wolinskyi]